MKIKGSTPYVKSLDAVFDSINELSFQLERILNQGVSFADNFDAVKITVADSGTADTALHINHGLGRAPIGFIPTLTDRACSIYMSGSVVGNITQATLFCNVDNAYFEGYLF